MNSFTKYNSNWLLLHAMLFLINKLVSLLHFYYPYDRQVNRYQSVGFLKVSSILVNVISLLLR